LLNEQGTVAKAYKIFRCWVSEYDALPELDANGKAIAIEKIVLQNEGWVRDTSVTEPSER
jgi:phage tail-like protein